MFTKFRNIISLLRKEKGWTQTRFAEKLGISPQSISKWECSVSYPDVMLFPVLSDLLEVPIEVLFGKEIKFEEETMRTTSEYSGEFETCKNIKVYLGNACRVEWIEDQGEKIRVKAKGTPVFLEYFNAEQDGKTLRVDVRNPCGSGTRWESYDREGFIGENFIQINTPATDDMWF